MKIGIFGDSFAKGSPLCIDTHWYTVLGKMLNADVTTHGLGATALLYSYEIFLKWHTRYDLNIFVVTHYERYTKPVYLASTGQEPHWISSYNQVENIKKTYPVNPSELQYLNKIQNWFIVSDDKFMKTAHELMVRDVLSKANNVIIIPAFHEDFSLNARLKEELEIKSSLWDFLIKQRESLGIHPERAEGWSERPEVIGCHLTPETNKAVAQAVHDLITAKKPIEVPDVIEHEHPVDYYFKRAT
jgi:hypothetical protein